MTTEDKRTHLGTSCGLGDINHLMGTGQPPVVSRVDLVIFIAEQIKGLQVLIQSFCVTGCATGPYIFWLW